MKITEFCLNNRTTTLVLTAVTIVGGLMSYGSMGRLEDPEFTIKDALIITPYPGASAAEVEEEVSDQIERAVQALGQLKEVKSRSSRGLSIVTATMKGEYDGALLPQVWDELRRKVGDTQRNLPPGAGPSIVNDDFGDVFGVFFAIYGEEYSYAELWDVAKLLRRELLLVQDVAKIEVFGYPSEVAERRAMNSRDNGLVRRFQLIEQIRQKRFPGRLSEFLDISTGDKCPSLANDEQCFGRVPLRLPAGVLDALSHSM